MDVEDMWGMRESIVRGTSEVDEATAGNQPPAS